MGLDTPNGGELHFIGRQVASPPSPYYSLRMANEEVERIGLYYDLDLRPLVSTPMVPVPTKAAGAISSYPGVPDTGDPSLQDEDTPTVIGGF